MPIDPALFNKVAEKIASQASTEAMIGLPLLGTAVGGVTGAGMGALYNAFSDKPELFYDDLGRGAARGALTGGGAGLGMSAGHAATVGTDDEPRAVGLGGRAGAGLGYILGRALIARDDDAPAKARVKKKKKTKKASAPTPSVQGTQPMGINLNLLRKVAKVYEAAESVDNMPVKHTRESHKKCAPGEFGLNKEGADPRAMMVGGSGKTAPKPPAIPLPDKNMAVDMSAFPGGHNTAAGIPRQTTMQEIRQVMRDNPFAALDTLNMPQRQVVPGYSRNPAAGITKTNSARQFGASVKQALDPALGMAGLGGAGGALAGGLSGLIAPGEYEDEDGNVKRRGRLSAALQRALGMGAVGAGLGGAYGMYDREGSGKAVDFARQLYQSLMGGGSAKPEPKTAPSPVTYNTPADGPAKTFNTADPLGDATARGLENFSQMRDLVPAATTNTRATPRGKMTFNLENPTGLATDMGLENFMPTK